MLTNCVDQKNMLQSQAAGSAGLSGFTVNQPTSSVRKSQDYNNLGFSTPNGQQCIKSSQRQREPTRVNQVTVLVSDSECEPESDSKPDLNNTLGTREGSQQSTEPALFRCVPNRKICNFLNTKDLLNYSIPVSSESESEQNSEVNNRKVREKRSEEELYDSQDIEKKKRKTSKRRSKALLNSIDVTEENSNRKVNVDESSSCNPSKSALLKRTLGRANNPIRSSVEPTSNLKGTNNKDNLNQTRNMLVQNSLLKNKQMVDDQNIIYDRKSKKKKKRKRKNEEVGVNGCSEGAPERQRQTRQPSPEVGITVADKASVQFQESLFSPVAGELVCAGCRTWMASKEVYLCECRLVCEVCRQFTQRCDDCGLTFAEDARFTRFHQRLCRLIDRECRYREAGCTALVRPDDMHELSCSYKPFICAKCNKDIPNKNVTEHFENEHHLTPISHDVKITDFYVNPETGNREVCCFTTRKQRVYLTINKSEEDENAKFIVNSGDIDVSVKLLFKKEVFRYECDNKTQANGCGVSFIDVSKKAINYWFNDECVLDISVRTKSKKQLSDGTSNKRDETGCNEESRNQTRSLENRTTNIEKKKKDHNISKKRKKQ